MQWDASPGGGFTSGTPWLPLVDPDRRSVAAQAGDEGSLLSLYRRLIAARRTHPALGRGSHRSVFGVAPDVLAWLREADGQRVLVLLNTGNATRACSLTKITATRGEALVGTGDRIGEVSLGDLVLEPLEGLALRI